MSDERVEALLVEIAEEYRSAASRFPPFHSPHEGYAVLLEEVDELWDEVRRKGVTGAELKAEALQVAAMGLRFMVDCCAEPLPCGEHPVQEGEGGEGPCSDPACAEMGHHDPAEHAAPPPSEERQPDWWAVLEHDSNGYTEVVPQAAEWMAKEYAEDDHGDDTGREVVAVYFRTPPRGEQDGDRRFSDGPDDVIAGLPTYRTVSRAVLAERETQEEIIGALRARVSGLEEAVREALGNLTEQAPDWGDIERCIDILTHALEGTDNG